MGSSTAKVDRRFPNGVEAFRINGVVHHRMGSLIPSAGYAPQCAQVYVLHHAEQLQAWQSKPFSVKMDPIILQKMGAMLEMWNPFVQQFQSAARIDVPNLHLRISAATWRDQRVYNMPTTAEIAVFIPEAETHIAATTRDIVV